MLNLDMLPGKTKELKNTELNEYVDNKKKNKKILRYMVNLENKIDNEIRYLYDDQLDYVDLTGWKFSPSERMASCMNYWDSDIYNESKVINITRVSRCKCKFCVNCKNYEVAKNLAKVSPIVMELSKKYIPFLLTLTIPNVSKELYRETVIKLCKKFQKVIELFSSNINSWYAYKERKFDIVGAIRALETTTNKKDETYHPHIHALIFIDTDNLKQFDKTNRGEYNTKTRSYNMISDADIEIRKIWTRLYNDIDRRQQDFDMNSYMCDIRPIDTGDIKGILEVLKYAFKTRDITSYDVFETLYNGTYKRRLKQGYGLLYNLKFEERDDSAHMQSLLFQELPEHEKINLNDLVSKYGEYTKVTNFQSIKDVLEYIKPMLDD